MQIAIRKASSEDATGIKLLSGQLGYTPDILQTALYIDAINERNDDVIYVAVVKNNVVGWVHTFTTIRLESGLWAEIGGLVVDEDHRSLGIGKLLVDKSKAWCSLKGILVLRVRSNIKRVEAHQFYEKLGFTELKHQKVFEIKL